MSDLIIDFYELFHQRQQDFIWRESIYVQVFITVILIVLAAIILYYHVINRITYKYSTITSYVFYLILLSLICSITSYIMAVNLGEFESLYETSLLTFALINFFFGGLLFLALSYLGRYGSPNAKYVPYKKIGGK